MIAGFDTGREKKFCHTRTCPEKKIFVSARLFNHLCLSTTDEELIKVSKFLQLEQQ